MTKADKTAAVQWPADKVERRKVADLIPYARNSRTHSEEQVGQIAASIREWGWTIPVLIDPEGTIIAGHGRIMAAQKLGIDEVPCMVAEGWTDAQRRAYVLADNKLALNAGWDNELLKVELQHLEFEKFDVGLVGFSVGEIDNLFFDGNFEPVSGDEQGGLDAKTECQCPACGEVFDPVVNRAET